MHLVSEILYYSLIAFCVLQVHEDRLVGFAGPHLLPLAVRVEGTRVLLLDARWHRDEVEGSFRSNDCPIRHRSFIPKMSHCLVNDDGLPVDALDVSGVRVDLLVPAGAPRPGEQRATGDQDNTQKQSPLSHLKGLGICGMESRQEGVTDNVGRREL